MDIDIKRIQDFSCLDDFECGIAQMDDFIHEHLKSCDVNHYCKTYIASDKETGTLVGMFALSFDSVSLDSGDFEDMHIGAATTDEPDVEESFRERFEQKCLYPALEITYIAIAKKYQGQNIGSELVDEVVRKAKEQDLAGCLFLTVNALHTKEYSAVPFYEKCRFAILTPVPRWDIWPMYKTLWVR